MMPAIICIIGLCVLSTVTVQSLLVAANLHKPTQVAVQPKSVPKVIQKPVTSQTKKPSTTSTGKSTSKPAPKPVPAVKKPTPPPPPPPSLPAVAGKTTSYSLGVLVLKYFPLTSNGQNINIKVTGDVGDSYSYIRQKTTDIDNNLLKYLPKATQYLGYKYGGDKPSLTYHIVATHEYKTAVPINSILHAGYVTYPDYPGIMSSQNICSYVDTRGVHEVWMWAYQGPNQPSKNNQPYLGIEESKMSGPHGDISNSFRWDDMPHCKHTYVVYTFNYGRGTAEAIHSWGHQIESEMSAVDSNLFSKFQGPNYPQALKVTGRCGSVHNPPNAVTEYDWSNASPWKSDCEDWNPNGIGTTTMISCKIWGCSDISDTNNSQLNYMVWMWQHLPGMNNTKTYQGKQLRNWWDIHGEFDTVMSSSKRLTL